MLGHWTALIEEAQGRQCFHLSLQRLGLYLIRPNSLGKMRNPSTMKQVKTVFKAFLFDLWTKKVAHFIGNFTGYHKHQKIFGKKKRHLLSKKKSKKYSKIKNQNFEYFFD